MQLRPGVVYRVGAQGARVRLNDDTEHDFPAGSLVQVRHAATVVSGEMFVRVTVDPSTYETQDRKPRRKATA